MDYLPLKWNGLFLEHKNMLFVLRSRKCWQLFDKGRIIFVLFWLFLICVFFFFGLLCSKISVNKNKERKSDRK